jgi:hypothetical protein
MAGIDRVEARFEFLAVATGVEDVTKIILPKDGKLGDGIADRSFASLRVSRRRKFSEVAASVW